MATFKLGDFVRFRDTFASMRGLGCCGKVIREHERDRDGRVEWENGAIGAIQREAHFELCREHSPAREVAS